MLVVLVVVIVVAAAAAAAAAADGVGWPHARACYHRKSSRGASLEARTVQRSPLQPRLAPTVASRRACSGGGGGGGIGGGGGGGGGSRRISSSNATLFYCYPLLVACYWLRILASMYFIT